MKTTQIAVATNIAYSRRQSRASHPDGKTDSGGRWYPTDEEDAGDISCRVRSPSRAWPWSYMVACRARRHCKILVERAIEGCIVPRDIQAAVDEASRTDTLPIAIMSAKVEARA